MKLSTIGESRDVVAAIRKAIAGVDYTDRSGDPVRYKGWAGSKEAGVQVFWHQWDKKVFISTGDWADPKPWWAAVKAAVRTATGGDTDIDGDAEARPSGPGWAQVTERGKTDVHDVHDVHEGVVTAARSDIVNIVNDLAGKIAGVAERIFLGNRRLSEMLFIRKPTVDFAESEEDPAVVTIAMGRRMPQSIAVSVYGDGGGEMRMEISQQLSDLLQVARVSTLSSEAEVDRRFVAIIQAIDKQLRRNRDRV